MTILEISPKPRTTVLVVDDNPKSASVVQDYLEAYNYHVITAQNGQDAVFLAQKHHPDVILMDIQMPVMDGITAMRMLRADPNTSNIVIIALTALAMPGDRERCLEAGADEYISKPIRLKHLTEQITHLLEVRREKQA